MANSIKGICRYKNLGDMADVKGLCWLRGYVGREGDMSILRIYIF